MVSTTTYKHILIRLVTSVTDPSRSPGAQTLLVTLEPGGSVLDAPTTFMAVEQQLKMCRNCQLESRGTLESVVD